MTIWPWSPSTPLWLRRAHLLLPLAALPVCVLAWAVLPRYYAFFVREDRAAEWLTVACYAAAGLISITSAALLWRRRLRLPAALHLVLALGLLFIAGEEASWGQRQFGFAGPEAIVSRNLQDEANLHNLLSHGLLHSVYIAVGLYGMGLGRLLLPRVPVLRNHAEVLAPPRSLAPYFLVVTVYYAYWFVSELLVVPALGADYDFERIERLQEVPELVMAAGFLLFTIFVRDVLQGHAEGGRPSASDGSDRRHGGLLVSR